MVSIILPVFNQSHALPANAAEHFKSEYPNYEIIVIDGTCTDRS